MLLYVGFCFGFRKASSLFDSCLFLPILHFADHNSLRISIFDSVLIGTVKIIFYLRDSDLREFFLSELRFCFCFSHSQSQRWFRLISPRAVSLRTVSRVLEYNADSFPLSCIWHMVCKESFRYLPVHWYHLFVSIRYHKFFCFSIWDII